MSCLYRPVLPSGENAQREFLSFEKGWLRLLLLGHLPP